VVNAVTVVRGIHVGNPLSVFVDRETLQVPAWNVSQRLAMADARRFQGMDAIPSANSVKALK